MQVYNHTDHSPEGCREGDGDQMLHGDIEFHYSLCFHALQLMRTSGG